MNRQEYRPEDKLPEESGVFQLSLRKQLSNGLYCFWYYGYYEKETFTFHYHNPFNDDERKGEEIEEIVICWKQLEPTSL